MSINDINQVNEAKQVNEVNRVNGAKQVNEVNRINETNQTNKVNNELAEQNIFEIKDLSYSYDGRSQKVLSGISKSFQQGKVYAVVGKSGAGKTTLLSLLSGLTKPTEGNIIYKGKDVTSINPYEYRSNYVGVIFQSFNLLPNLTAKENVVLSMDISNKIIEDKNGMATALLESVGLDAQMIERRILKLSGGEQQRVAIARTLGFGPDVILADEPTGNLDEDTQKNIIDIFKGLAHDDGKCVIIVTHSPLVASSADEIVELDAINNN